MDGAPDTPAEATRLKRMQAVAVRCVFALNGEVQVQQIERHGRWLSIGQGRQWLDDEGRHVLALLPTHEVVELLLQPSTLTWVMRSTTARHTIM